MLGDRRTASSRPPAPGAAVAAVFISYSRHDGELVRELHAFLSAGGRDVWVDWEDIPPASQWEQDIEASIDAAESVVFVVSGDSLASGYCLAELRRAQECGKRIVPLALDGADPAAAPEGLRQLNWIWCRAGDDRDEAFAKLTRALDTDLAWARAHTRLLVRAVEWNARQDASLLLRGRDLEQVARELAANVGKEPVPTELQHRYVLASRRAAATRQRIVLGGVLVALAVSVALGILALLQRNDARAATRRATSVALASTSNLRVASNPDQALLLGLDAYALSPSAEARNAAFGALETARKLGVTALLHAGSAVESVAFAPDGRMLAVGGADGSVRLWDIRARAFVGELGAPGGSPIVTVGFARHGSVVAAGSEDGRVRLWDVRSRRPAERALATGRGILASAVSPDARSAAAIDGAGHVWLWSLSGGEPRRLAGPRGDHAVLAFSPDGKTLAAGATRTAAVEEGEPGAVRLWDVPSASSLGELPSDDSVEDLAFAPGGRTLAVAGYANSLAGKYGQGDLAYGEVVLWKVPALRAEKQFKSRSFVRSLAFSAGGRTIAAGLDDGTIRLLDALDLRARGSLATHLAGAPARLALSSDDRTIAAAADGDASVRLWNLGNRASFPRTTGSEDDVLDGLAFSPDGGTVAAAGGDGGDIRLVNVARGTSSVPRWLRRTGSGAEEVAFSDDGTFLAARKDGGSVQLWNLRTRRPAGRVPGDGSSGFFGVLAFDPAGEVLAIGSDLGALRLWDVRRQALRKPQMHTAGVLALAFVDGGRTLVTASSDGSVQLWDVATATARAPPLRPLSGASSAALSADGRTVAFADSAGRVWVWGRRSGGPAAELAVAPRAFPRLALSADGRTLAVAPQDSDVELWDVRSRTPLGSPLPGARGNVAIGPDGRTIATGSGVVQLWSGILWSDLADLRAQVCGLVLGDLTRAEWTAIAPGLAYRSTCRR